MRITAIEVSKFKAFYDTCSIDLGRNCKNLLVYGENGSGKTSLYQALRLFLDSASKGHQFVDHRNIFVPGDDGHVRIHLREDPTSPQLTYEWSSAVTETNDPLILSASKAKGFLDYKSLLETYFLHRGHPRVNIFDLLVHNLLANTTNDVTQRTFAEDWEAIIRLIPNMNIPTKVKPLESEIEGFNVGMRTKLDELKSKAAGLLAKFGYEIEVQDLQFNGIRYNNAPRNPDKAIVDKEIVLKVQFFNRDLRRHHLFLNEAKLSAIAISLYLASLLLIPQTDLQILVLDDVLIGLDMSNRLPVIDILDNHFSDYQIVLTTYDRNWFEMVRLRTRDAGWEYVDFFSSSTDSYELPVVVQNKDYLSKAKAHFTDKDYKACVIYLRTAFEHSIKRFCHKRSLKVKYNKDPRKQSSEDFWLPIRTGSDRTGNPYLTPNMISDVELYRKFILNPLSHATVVNIVEREVDGAIQVVEQLDRNLRRIT